MITAENAIENPAPGSDDFIGAQRARCFSAMVLVVPPLGQKFGSGVSLGGAMLVVLGSWRGWPSAISAASRFIYGRRFAIADRIGPV